MAQKIIIKTFSKEKGAEEFANKLAGSSKIISLSVSPFRTTLATRFLVTARYESQAGES